MRGKSILSGNKVHQFNLNTLRLDKELEALQIDLLLLPGEIQKRAVVAAQWHTAMDKQVCFPRNTKIETLTGEKRIQDITKSDLVLSHLGWRKVKQIIKREYSGEMVKIDTSDGKSLMATAEHPIHVEEKGWISIQKLRKTDRLRISASQQCYDQFNPKDKIVHVINKLTMLWQALNVYNLEVEVAHTFYANGILVHNCPLCNSLQGEIIPVDSPEWGRIAPPVHLACRCVLSFITADERGVIPRLERYKPVDPDLLAKWSSKIYTDAEIREMVKARMAAGDPLDVSVAHESFDILNKSGKEKLGREYGIFFDEKGKIVLRRTGDSNSISFSEKQLEAARLSKSKVFLHNHPSGGAFSIDDLNIAPELGVKEMRVAGDKFKYSIQPKQEGKWPAHRDVFNAFKRKEDDLTPKYLRIYERTHNQKTTWIAHSDEIWRSISDDLGLIYKRELR